jgi:phage host-nuclease inhibitor protein Gam
MSSLEVFREEEAQAPEGFICDSLSKAEWCLKTKGRAEEEIERFTAMAKQLIEEETYRINMRLAEIIKPHLRTLEDMTTFLRPWSEVEIAKAHGKKSVKLLSGTVGFRKEPKSLEVEDEEKAVVWLEANGHADCVRVRKTVKKDETKKLIEDKGELPDSCKLMGGGEVFYAKPLHELLEGTGVAQIEGERA